MSEIMSANSLLEKLGMLLVAIVTLRLTRTALKFLYVHVFGSLVCRSNVDFRKCGKWAVVTGATDGLGKAFARQLAGRGLDVVLVSRTQAKLDATAEEIRAEHPGRQVKCIQADFLDADADALYGHVGRELQGLEVGVLVNNVGLSYPYPEYFHKAVEDPEKGLSSGMGPRLFDNLVRCNVTSVINMCRIVIPGMAERRRGCIINISSVTANIPSPLLTVYGATKKFVEKFSQELNTEYGGNDKNSSNITVQCIMPGYVATNMSKISRPSLLVPTPEKFVRSALKTTGLESVTTGYLPHTIMLNVIKFAEGISSSFMARTVKNDMLSIRTRAFLKMAREEANKSNTNGVSSGDN